MDKFSFTRNNNLIIEINRKFYVFHLKSMNMQTCAINFLSTFIF